jgi:hypothetical protein
MAQELDLWRIGARAAVRPRTIVIRIMITTPDGLRHWITTVITEDPAVMAQMEKWFNAPRVA